MNSKRFSKDLYEKHNQPAIQAAYPFLAHYGYTVVDVTESFKSHDIIVEKNGTQFKVELEHSETWTCPTEWQGWMKHTTPARKHQSKADLLIRFNQPLTVAAVIPMAAVLTAKRARKDTKYTKNEEFFFNNWDDYDYFLENEPLNQNRYL